MPLCVSRKHKDSIPKNPEKKHNSCITCYIHLLLSPNNGCVRLRAKNCRHCKMYAKPLARLIHYNASSGGTCITFTIKINNFNLEN